MRIEIVGAGELSGDEVARHLEHAARLMRSWYASDAPTSTDAADRVEVTLRSAARNVLLVVTR